MRTFLLLTTIALLLAPLAAGTRESRAQAPSASTGGIYVDEVRSKLDHFARQSVYRQTHDLFFDNLRDGAYQNVMLELSADTEYLVVGACDRDCKDIGFEIYGEDGGYLAGDSGTGEVSVLEVTPRWTGEFTLKVRMQRCAADPCYWGIGVYQR
jgi:hypothetical protein